MDIVKIGSSSPTVALSSVAIAFFYASLCTAIAQISAPKEISSTGADANRVLHYRSILPTPLDQQYEIEIFENGDVIYFGLGNVRITGRHQLTASPEEVRKVIDQLWQRPDPPGQPIRANQISKKPAPPPVEDAETHGIVITGNNWFLEIRKGEQNKTFERASKDPMYDKWLRANLEALVSTRSMRCPFLLERGYRLTRATGLPKGSDLCKFRDETDSTMPMLYEILGEKK